MRRACLRLGLLMSRLPVLNLMTLSLYRIAEFALPLLASLDILLEFLLKLARRLLEFMEFAFKMFVLCFVVR